MSSVYLILSRDMYKYVDDTQEYVIFVVFFTDNEPRTAAGVFDNEYKYGKKLRNFLYRGQNELSQLVQ